MKILLCYPTVSEEYSKIRDAGLTPHLSLLCIASHLKTKFDDVDIDIIDGHHMSYEEICKKISANNYDVVLFDLDHSLSEINIVTLDKVDQILFVMIQYS